MEVSGSDQEAFSQQIRDGDVTVHSPPPKEVVKRSNQQNRRENQNKFSQEQEARDWLRRCNGYPDCTLYRSMSPMHMDAAAKYLAHHSDIKTKPWEQYDQIDGDPETWPQEDDIEKIIGNFRRHPLDKYNPKIDGEAQYPMPGKYPCEEDGTPCPLSADDPEAGQKSLAKAVEKSIGGLTEQLRSSTTCAATFVFRREHGGEETEDRATIVDADDRMMTEILNIVASDEACSIFGFEEEELEAIRDKKKRIMFTTNNLSMTEQQMAETSVKNFWGSQKRGDVGEPVIIVVGIEDAPSKKNRRSYSFSSCGSGGSGTDGGF
jgi:hypothetical protein